MNRYLVPFSISIIAKVFFYRFIDTDSINDSPSANCDVLETNACTFMLCNGVVKFWREVTIQLGG